MRSAPAVFVASLLLFTPASAPVHAEEPSLKQVVERLGRYVDDYGTRLSIIVGIERYWQRSADATMERTLVSEIAFVPVGGDWLAYRDVFEVDGRRVGDRSDRLQRLLVEPSRAALEQARRIADESARYNLGEVRRNINTPTMALFAMRTENRRRFKYWKEGVEQASAGTLWTVRFEERDRPTIVRTPEGRDVPMRGYLRMRPADGAVVRTELTMDSQAGVRATVTVVYRLDDRLGSLLPATMDEAYDRVTGPSQRPSAATMSIVCRATYSDYRRFETATRLIIPK
jgi:hypothetical protein